MYVDYALLTNTYCIIYYYYYHALGALNISFYYALYHRHSMLTIQFSYIMGFSKFQGHLRPNVIIIHSENMGILWGVYQHNDIITPHVTNLCDVM